MRYFLEQLRRKVQTGISYTLPVLIVGGVCGRAALWCEEPLREMLLQAARICEWLVPAIFSAYTAYALAGRPAIAPGILAGWFAQQWGEGVLGALVGALLCAAVVKGLWYLPFPHDTGNIKSLLVLPCVATGGPMLALWILAPPVKGFLHAVGEGWGNAPQALPIICGSVIAGALSLDMGGDKGNWSSLIANLLLMQGVLWPTAAKIAGSIVPVLILALHQFITKRPGAFRLLVQGSCQITEGVLPYLHHGPQGLIPACMAGSAVAGALAVGGGVQCAVPHGGLFLLLFMEQPFCFLAALTAGSALGAVLLFAFQKLPLLACATTKKEKEKLPVEWVNF